jgi:3',5'-cyclic AMP phosphodiesterase CpdA
MQQVKSAHGLEGTRDGEAERRRPGGHGFLLAHISDPHLSSPEGVRYRELLGKRLLGYLSWRTRRREEHRSEILQALLHDVGCALPDHIVITGDLTHLALPQEFREAERWLAEVGPASKVTVVPGNHDAYAGNVRGMASAYWAPYMVSDAGERPVAVAASDGLFPTLRIRDSIALIGLNSARPSAPMLAVGTLGKAQLQDLEVMLAATLHRGLFRILLIHHPPVAGIVDWRKRLTDAAALAALLSRYGVELVLHGHAHRSTLTWIDVPGGRAPVIGIPSASAFGRRAGRRAKYHLCRIARRNEGWCLHTFVREYCPVKGGFVPEGEFSFLVTPANRPSSSGTDTAQVDEGDQKDDRRR